MYRYLLTLIALCTQASLVLAEAPDNFNEAKRIGWAIYAERPVDFYCGCHYDAHVVDLASCGYVPRKQPKRAARVEWEHIVPAWTIGHLRQCWQNGGRKNCEANDPVFRQAEADLHNLVPADGEVNGDRDNFDYGMLQAPATQYGACPMVIDFAQKVAMPPETDRGVVARVSLYMSQQYDLPLSDKQRQLFDAWNAQYPVNEWERWRNQKVGCVMGHGNPLVGPVDLDACRNNSVQ